MHSGWFSLMIYWRTDDDRAQFKFDSYMILLTNHNFLLSIATNQFTSFCIDNRLRQSAIFVSVKMKKFKIKRLFFSIIIISILYYLEQLDSMLPCICSIIDHRGCQNVVRNISDTLGCASCTTSLSLPHFDFICDLLLNRRMATWNLFVKQTTAFKDVIFFFRCC